MAWSRFKKTHVLAAHNDDDARSPNTTTVPGMGHPRMGNRIVGWGPRARFHASSGSDGQSDPTATRLLWLTVDRATGCD